MVDVEDHEKLANGFDIFVEILEIKDVTDDMLGIEVAARSGLDGGVSANCMRSQYLLSRHANKKRRTHKVGCTTYNL